MNGDIDDDVENSVGFLPTRKLVAEENKSNADEIGPLLTRDDLLNLDTQEPCWKRARLILLVLFWVVWIGLLTTAITIIVFTPKCPPRPKLEFWQSKVGYWVNPFAFRDSTNDMIGDFRGLAKAMNYIKYDVGAGYIILGSFLSGYYTNEETELGLTDNFTSIDAALGTMDDLRALIKTYHKNGLEVVVTLDFNSISLSHPWAQEPSLLKPMTAGKMVARDGRDAAISINNKMFYSVGSKNKVDLNLQSPEVLQRILDVVKFWLAEGVDGILLSDAAFFVEENTISSTDTLVKVENNNKWFSKYPVNQLFTNASVAFIKSVRSVIDEASKRTTRQRLLAVDSGDYGYGLRDVADDALKFLGTDEDPGAHLVISRQFVNKRGWKAIPSNDSWTGRDLQSYESTYPNFKSKLGLVTSTPSDQRHDDIFAVASMFLLPGSPIIYYGSELSTSFSPRTESPKNFYPKGKVPFPNLSPMDSALTCHLPMPWSISGTEFSGGVTNASFLEYLKTFSVKETVQSALSAGRGPTPLRFVQKIITLRKIPSLAWGEFEIFIPNIAGEGMDAEIFVRRAEQFPAVIVALVPPSMTNGAVYDFSSICDSIIPRVIYPPKEELLEDVKVESKAVYLKSNSKPSIYVFECT